MIQIIAINLLGKNQGILVMEWDECRVHIVSEQLMFYKVHNPQVILEDTKRLPDCVKILDKLTEEVGKLYNDAGRGIIVI